MEPFFKHYLFLDYRRSDPLFLLLKSTMSPLFFIAGISFQYCRKLPEIFE